MKIASIKMEGFRRFKNLTIKDIPEEARLVVMIGPNGSGKSSVFDALLRLKYLKGGLSGRGFDSYYTRFDLSEEVSKEPTTKFYTSEPQTREEWQKSVHVRSAYRNDALDRSHSFLSETNPLIEQLKFTLLAENDQTVASNFDRILGPWVERMSARKEAGEEADEIENDLYGELRDTIHELFNDPQLTLTGLGNPQNQKIFKFNKGLSKGFSYENLSSGEKAALDLVLDIIVAKSEFNDTVFCIDEPEAHIHTKLQGPLLNQLYKLIPCNSQLWIATHSIGMVRMAQDLWREGKNKGKDSVVFLNFGDETLNFDDEATITPTNPDPDLWERTYEIALGDMVELLVTSEQFIFCEGENFDELCYNKIFASRYPETRFFSVGGKGSVKKVVKALRGRIAKGVKVIGVVDRDRSTCNDIERNREEGIQTLKCGKIEDYLLHDDVLTQLCMSQGKPDKAEEFLQAKNEKIEEVMSDDNIHDKRRPIIQRIQVQAEIILGLSHSGDTTESFMTDILAPLIKPDTAVYDQLHQDIFGE
ncbi:MAG: AAA family ATPase [Candidatus Poribacteria bacterium]|nr:AAA family ATPase [Candidatus Poribacteria bacterium]